MDKKQKLIILSAIIILAGFGFLFSAGQAQAYVNSGTFTSNIIDTGQNSIWGTMTWSDTLPTGTSISMKVRSCDDASCVGETAFASITVTVTKGQDISSLTSVSDGHRWIQYQATLSTTDTSQTPQLNDVTINYTYYSVSASATLISSPYNTSDINNLLSKIQWTESLPTGTDIKFQLRTAPNSAGVPGTWSSWCGPDNGTAGCSTTTYFTDPAGGEIVDADFKDEANDQWIQYKVFLETTDSIQTPTLSDVTLQYVVNAPPEFDATYGNNGVTASQGSDTKVTIDYKIRDPDTTSGTNTPGYITPSFQYSLDGGSSWTTITQTYLAAGDLNNKAVEEVNYILYTATWDAQAQLGFETNIATAQIKVTINDDEAANNTASQASANFNLDTTPLSNISASQSTEEATFGKVKVNYDYLVSSGAQASSTVSLQYWNGSSWSGASTTTGDIGQGLTSGTGKQILWSAKDDFSNQYTTAAKVRLIASYQLASQTLESSTFILDTKNPLISLNIDARDSVPPNTPGTLNISASDNSSIQMMLSNNANFSPDGFNTDSGTWISFATSKSWFLNTEQTTVYLKIRDQYGNQTNTSQVPPRKPSSLFFRDVSNPSDENYRIFIAWGTIPIPNPGFKDYKLWYSTSSADGVYYLAATITSRTTNYFIAGSPVNSPPLNNELNSSSTYWFKLYSEDNSDNISQWSSAVPPDGDVPDGAGGSDILPPAIFNVNTSQVNTTFAVITWTTDELSDSTVGYSTDQTYSTETGVSSYVLNHSVVLTGLTPNTTYYFRVKSADSANPVNTSDWATGYQFTTNPGPVISGTTVSSVTNYSVTINWLTDIAANSSVIYSPNSDLSNSSTKIIDTETPVTNHSVTITEYGGNPLNPGTRYWYYVESTESGNTATDNNGGEYYFFKTTQDTTPPTITFTRSTDVRNLSSASVDIVFITNEYATGKVNYGTTDSYGSSETESNYNLNHLITLSGLNPGQIYHFQIQATDQNSNTTSTSDYTFTTLQPTDTTPPTISNLSCPVTLVTSFTATITWTTNELANSLVDYGSTTGYGFTQGNSADSETDHSVTLVGLSASTSYYFQAKSQDAAGNTVTSPCATAFTTSEAPPPPPEGDTTPPTIIFDSQTGITNIISSSAKISWTTDETSDSTIGYSTSQGVFTFEQGSASLVVSHSVTLTNLSQNATYYFRIKSADQYGNRATDDNSGQGYTFTTSSGADTVPPIISKVVSSGISISQATITWTTDENANSLVDYGITTSYGSTIGNASERVTSHTVTLSGLTGQTKYYFRVRSSDANSNQAIDDNNSAGYTFTTISDTTAPTISNVTTAVIRDVSAVVTWQTDELSTSQVAYGTTISYGSLTAEDITLTIQHSVTISGLAKETTYYYKVISKDASNNSAQNDNSGQGYTFTTTKTPGEVITIGGGGGGGGGTLDIWPPKISGLKITNITKSSVTISWQTDEEGSSLIAYGKSKDYGSLGGNAENKVTNHQVALSNLVSGTTYYFKAMSFDSSGNKGYSTDQTFTTLGEGAVPETPTTSELPPEELASLQEEIAGLFSAFSAASIGEVFNEIAERMVSVPSIAGGYPQIEVSQTTAKITWLTDKKANSLVAYTTEDKYDPTKDEPYSIISGYPDEMVTLHQVEINGLEPATIYYYQVRSKPLVGPIAKSENKTFETLSLKLEISDITLQIITESEVAISWKTNLPSATKIEYTNLRTGEKKELEDISYLREHTISLKGLESNTDYSFFIKAIDEMGSETISPTLTFSTGKDIVPPEISQVRTSVAISPQGDTVQTIIIWLTNEFSSSRVYYLEGVTWREELVKSTSLDKTLVQKHTVVIPVLKPGQVYRFRVESIDPSENVAISKDYTLLTPQQRRTIVQIMISQFGQIFGWVKRLGI